MIIFVDVWYGLLSAAWCLGHPIENGGMIMFLRNEKTRVSKTTNQSVLGEGQNDAYPYMFSRGVFSTWIAEG